MIDETFWRGRCVLLTGHTGFKGSWLGLWLQKLGADVHGFALPADDQPSLFEMARLEGRIHSTYGDLRDHAAVEAMVQRTKPQIVLHLAAQSLVHDSLADPVGTMATNIMGTVHLLEALRDSPGLSTVLVVSSDKVYANDERGLPFTEGDQLGGKDPYSASKAAAELVTRAYHASFFGSAGIRVATARAGNVIGGGDYARDRIVPDIIRAMERGEPPVLRMPSATRPWQHVLDCLAGYLLFAQALDRRLPVPSCLNFGPEPGNPITVAELAAAVLEALGERQHFEHRPLPGSIERHALEVASERARVSLGWRDRLPGKAAVAWTADWYRQVRDGQDALDVSLRQIDAFTALSG
jgi:CDP-glucose 4,6-dehydratase